MFVIVVFGAATHTHNTYELVHSFSLFLSCEFARVFVVVVAFVFVFVFC